MSHVFSEYVRLVSMGEPLDTALFEEVQDNLRGALADELRKRGLWNAPPSHLGIHGFSSWSRPDALDELATDCFIFILDRLTSLEAQLKVKDNIEGLFFRNIQNFLYDTQKKHDPLGFRVFVVAQTTIRRLLQASILWVLKGEPKVRNDTVVGFDPAGDPERAHETDLGKRIRQWNGDLLPDLITARGKSVDEVVARLATRISRLPDEDVECFGFKYLVDSLKGDARARWNAIRWLEEGETAYEDGDGEEAFPVLVRLVRPDSGVEERELFGKLISCVAATLDRHETDVKARNYLEKLWDFLRNHAAEPENETPVRDTANPKASKPPSRRKISETLDIPRDRLVGLLATLGGFVKSCQAAILSPRD